MPTLRISHAGSHVESTLTDGGSTLSEKRLFSFSLSAQDAEDIRWYLEAYRIYPVEPAPRIAKRIEQRMGEAGRELFRLVWREATCGTRCAGAWANCGSRSRLNSKTRSSLGN